MATDSFTPTFLRSATAYGLSSRLRGDLVVNNLVGYAVTTGHVLIKSDGMPWRPLVHVEDIGRAFKCVIEAPAEAVRGEAFNVGQTGENYRVREIADLVAEIVQGATVTYGDSPNLDQRNYRVNCDKIRRAVPAFEPQWTLEAGIVQLYHAYRAAGLTEETFFSRRYFRIEHVKEQLRSSAFDGALMPAAA
jgi:nucleoside-diphosphate-sugar epimerase